MNWYKNIPSLFSGHVEYNIDYFRACNHPTWLNQFMKELAIYLSDNYEEGDVPNLRKALCRSNLVH